MESKLCASYVCPAKRTKQIKRTVAHNSDYVSVKNRLFDCDWKYFECTVSGCFMREKSSHLLRNLSNTNLKAKSENLNFHNATINYYSGTIIFSCCNKQMEQH